MSGFLALLDDIAALTRIAAVQVDDIAAQAAKVGAKTAGVIIDDAAVTPSYVQGLPAARELPIVGKIAAGSLFNKLVILLPIAMLLSAFAPWSLGPLLMLGGAYLCFEGAEKIWHIFHHAADAHPDEQEVTLDSAHLEKERVKGAIKTDFILSAEIMTISLAAIEATSIWKQALILALVAILITVAVYGAVAILVKADDVGLKMAQDGKLQATRSTGRAIVQAMPGFMKLVSSIGTAAMLWVGGSIIIHAVEELGFGFIAHQLEHFAHVVHDAMTIASGFFAWLVEAVFSGLFGLLLGAFIVACSGLLSRFSFFKKKST